jgi:hypothetical protein
VLWCVFVGLGMAIGIVTSDEPHLYLRRSLVSAVGGVALLEFYLNLEPFPVAVELLLQPAVVILVAVILVARRRSAPEVSVLAGRALVLVGGFALAWVSARLILSPETDWVAIGRSWVLVVGLTLAALPLVWAFGLLVAYESAWLHVARFTSDRHARLRSAAALLLALHVRIDTVQGFAGLVWPRELASAESFSAARDVMVRFQESFRVERALARKRIVDLEPFAGVDGTDDAGRRLDRREFAETRAALRWLATAQMGWFRNRGRRYRPDLVDVVRDWSRRGLPDDPAVRIVVRPDGRAWYAWRQTIGGWSIGIGAVGPPPDEWYYDGPEPPKGFPGEAPGWGDRAHALTLNWAAE